MHRGKQWPLPFRAFVIFSAETISCKCPRRDQQIRYNNAHLWASPVPSGQIVESGAPLPLPRFYFFALLLLRTAPHYLNAWNRLLWA